MWFNNNDGGGGNSLVSKLLENRTNKVVSLMYIGGWRKWDYCLSLSAGNSPVQVHVFVTLCTPRK